MNPINMFTFVEFSDYSLLQEYFAKAQNMDFLSVLEANSLNIERIKLSQWYELDQELDSSGNLFEDTIEKPYLINIQSLEIDSKVLKYLEKLNRELNAHVNFYSSALGGLSSENKKLWQKNGLNYVDLKKADEKVKLDLAKNYCEVLDLKLSELKIATLAKQSQNYQEVLDNLDFISLSDEPEKAYQSLLVEDKPLPFMLSFDVTKLDTQVSKWYSIIQENDIQLGLSLIFGKLDKQSSENAEKLIKKLILTDQKIKTRAKISPTLWWKLFLWEAKNI